MIRIREIRFLNIYHSRHYDRSRNRNDLSGAFLLSPKKAPRRNEGLGVKALEKLNEVIAYLIGAM